MSQAPRSASAAELRRQFHFYARQHIRYSAYMLRPPVRLSVTRVYCIKMDERIIEILSLPDRPIILVFRHKGRCSNMPASPPTGGAKYKGGRNFRPMCGYISETVIDRGIITMEDEYKVVCALSNSTAFDETLSDPEPQFQGHSIV